MVGSKGPCRSFRVRLPLWPVQAFLIETGEGPDALWGVEGLTRRRTLTPFLCMFFDRAECV